MKPLAGYARGVLRSRRPGSRGCPTTAPPCLRSAPSLLPASRAGKHLRRQHGDHDRPLASVPAVSLAGVTPLSRLSAEALARWSCVIITFRNGGSSSKSFVRKLSSRSGMRTSPPYSEDLKTCNQRSGYQMVSAAQNRRISNPLCILRTVDRHLALKLGNSRRASSL